MFQTIRAKLNGAVAFAAFIAALLAMIAGYSILSLTRSAQTLVQDSLAHAQIGHDLTIISNTLASLVPQIDEAANRPTLDTVIFQIEELLDRYPILSAQLVSLGSHPLPDGFIQQGDHIREQTAEAAAIQDRLFEREQTLKKALLDLDIRLNTVLEEISALRRPHSHMESHTTEMDGNLVNVEARHNRINDLLFRMAGAQDKDKLASLSHLFDRAETQLANELSAIPESKLHQKHREIIQQYLAAKPVMDSIPELRSQLLDDREALHWLLQESLKSVQRLAVASNSLQANLAAHAQLNITSIETDRTRYNLIIISSAAAGIMMIILVSGLLTHRGISERLETLRDQLKSGNIQPPLKDSGPHPDEIAEICQALEEITGKIQNGSHDLEKKDRELRHSREQAEQALTELRITQRSLIQSEKMVSIVSLVSNVAHEINTPLGAAVGVVTHLSHRLEKFSEKFEAGPLKRQDVKQFFEFVSEGAKLLQENIQRTIELANQFKQVSRQQDLDELKLVHFRDFLEQCVRDRRDLLRDGEIELAIHCPDNMEVAIHPGALTQILTTLIVNSVSHGFRPGQKGLITIMASPDTQNSGISIVYEDNGKGLSEEEKDRIFDPYFHSQQGDGGPGLGMLLIYSIITVRLQGSINIHSIPDEGVRFEILLPNIHRPEKNWIE